MKKVSESPVSSVSLGILVAASFLVVFPAPSHADPSSLNRTSPFFGCRLRGGDGDGGGSGSGSSNTISTSPGSASLAGDPIYGPTTFTVNFGGTWLVPTEAPDYSVSGGSIFKCTPASYPNLQNPNDPTSARPCSMKLTSPTNWTKSIGKDEITILSYIAYIGSSNLSDVQIQKVDYQVPDVYPGYVKTWYHDFMSFDAFHETSGPQYKVKVSSYTGTPSLVATGGIW